MAFFTARFPFRFGGGGPPYLPQDFSDAGLSYSSDVLTALTGGDTGTDISVLASQNGSWPERGGSPMVAEQLLRRITTPRGTLDFSPNDGIDVRDLVRDDMDQSGVFQAQQMVENEILKDERVEEVTVHGSFATDTQALTLSISVQRSADTFKLVLAVTDVTVDVLSAEAV